jgi:hypothetical protein
MDWPVESSWVVAEVRNDGSRWPLMVSDNRTDADAIALKLRTPSRDVIVVEIPIRNA